MGVTRIPEGLETDHFGDSLSRNVEGLLSGVGFDDLARAIVRDCAEASGSAAAGVMLADSSGRLHPIAASSVRLSRFEQREAQAGNSPFALCHRTGASVTVDNRPQAHWPQLAGWVRRWGYGSLVVLPVQIRDVTLGTLSLYRRPGEPLSARALDGARAAARLAALGIVEVAGLQARDVRVEQLQHALDSRVTIEQAKGRIAEHAQITVDQAFMLLRRYARCRQAPLNDVAGAIAARRVAPEEVT
jgi:hypothetical protein